MCGFDVSNKPAGRCSLPRLDGARRFQRHQCDPRLPGANRSGVASWAKKHVLLCGGINPNERTLSLALSHWGSLGGLKRRVEGGEIGADAAI